MAEHVEGSRLDIRCPEGSVLVVYYGVDGSYLTLEPADTRHPPIPLGTIQGEGALPALRWEELTQLDTWLRLDWHAVFPPEALVPLLTPFASAPAGGTPDEQIARVRPILLPAWRALNVLPQERLTHVVDALALHHLGQNQWWYHPTRGWMNDSLNKFPRQDFPIFQQFLDTAARAVGEHPGT